MRSTPWGLPKSAFRMTKHTQCYFLSSSRRFLHTLVSRINVDKTLCYIWFLFWLWIEKFIIIYPSVRKNRKRYQGFHDFPFWPSLKAGESSRPWIWYLRDCIQLWSQRHCCAFPHFLFIAVCSLGKLLWLSISVGVLIERNFTFLQWLTVPVLFTGSNQTEDAGEGLLIEPKEVI